MTRLFTGQYKVKKPYSGGYDTIEPIPAKTPTRVIEKKKKKKSK